MRVRRDDGAALEIDLCEHFAVAGNESPRNPVPDVLEQHIVPVVELRAGGHALDSTAKRVPLFTFDFSLSTYFSTFPLLNFSTYTDALRLRHPSSSRVAVVFSVVCLLCARIFEAG